MANREDFKRKMANQEAITKEIERFVQNGGNLESQEGMRLGIRLLQATSDTMEAAGYPPFVVPISEAEKKAVHK